MRAHMEVETGGRRLEKRYMGDGHSHSHWSDGLDSVEALSEFHKRLGFDFRFQTDHCGIRMPEGTYLRKERVSAPGHLLIPENFGKYLDDCEAASDGRHIVLPGIELDLDYMDLERHAVHNYCHVLVYGLSREIPLPPDGWYAAKSLLEVVAGLKAMGLTVGLAHVDDGGCFPPWQELPAQFDFMEMNYTCYADQTAPPGQGLLRFGFWDKWLSEGRRIPLTTGSDCHQADMAGFSMRNVVESGALTEAAILDAVKAGRSYLAGTWHPNIYRELGLDGAYWFKIVGGIDRKRAEGALKPVAERMFHDDYGRVAAENYPRLEFNVNGKGAGEMAEAGPDGRIDVGLKVNMNVNISSIDVIACGAIVERICPASKSFQGDIRLDGRLKSPAYVRVQVEGIDKAGGHGERLVSNPVYIGAMS